MVKVLWFQQGGVHPAGKHRRNTELCQSLDEPAVGEVSPLTIPVLTLLSRSYARLPRRPSMRRIPHRWIRSAGCYSMGGRWRRISEAAFPKEIARTDVRYWRRKADIRPWKAEN